MSQRCDFCARQFGPTDFRSTLRPQSAFDWPSHLHVAGQLEVQLSRLRPADYGLWRFASRAEKAEPDRLQRVSLGVLLDDLAGYAECVVDACDPAKSSAAPNRYNEPYRRSFHRVRRQVPPNLCPQSYWRRGPGFPMSQEFSGANRESFPAEQRKSRLSRNGIGRPASLDAYP